MHHEWSFVNLHHSQALLWASLRVSGARPGCTDKPCCCMLQTQEMQEVNSKLLARAQSVEEKHNQMMQHVTQMNECLKLKTLENERLQTELNLLKRSMKVSFLSTKEEILFRRARCVLMRTSCGLHDALQHVLGAW